MELLPILKCRLEQPLSHDGLLGYLWIFFRADDMNVGTIMGKTDRKISVMGTISGLFYCPLTGYINH